MLNSSYIFETMNKSFTKYKIQSRKSVSRKTSVNELIEMSPIKIRHYAFVLGS